MKHLLRLENWLYERLGDDWGGNTDPPGSVRGIDVGMPDDDSRPLYVVRTGNDGSELWIGFRTQWLFHCRAMDARRIAWFIVWDWWAVGQWFGLRSAIWYRLLRRSIRRHDKRMQARRAGRGG